MFKRSVARTLCMIFALCHIFLLVKSTGNLKGFADGVSWSLFSSLVQLALALWECGNLNYSLQCKTMGKISEQDELNCDSECCYLDETIPPCRECEKHFFHQQQTFNWLEAAVVLISIVTLVTDLVTDTLVTCQYFVYGEYAWGLLTLSFTLLPSLIIQFFSLRWYQMDEDLSNKKWIAHGLQLGPLYRYIVVLRTGMAAKRSGDPLDFDLLYHQQSDVCMLRLFESFMESAPQVVLQLYIMVATNEENFFTGISATVSLVSLCWAIAVYSRIHRRVREDKKVVSWPGVVLQAVWRIGMISSRVIALVLFATAFKAYVFVVIAIHWFVMVVWVFLQNTDFCGSWLEERLFNAVIAEVYIFCFFNLKEGTSRYRVFVFYSVIFIENVLCLVLWNSRAIEKGFYTEVGFSIVFGGFFVGVTSMVLYYRYLHPHSSVGCCKAGDKSKHQPCLKHEDLLNVSKGKGMEAEISPRSQTPSPCLQALDHHHSPLAIPMSQFTTPASRPRSPDSKPSLSVTYQDEVPHDVGDERQLKGLHRAKSESYLIQGDEASLTAGFSLAVSLNGLTFLQTSPAADSTSRWMDQFARERKSLTQDFFNFLSPDAPIGGAQVNRVGGQCAGAEVNNQQEAASTRAQNPKPQSLLRVDSISKKLLKGSSERKMHRSFRRQLRFEDKWDGEAPGRVRPAEWSSTPNRTEKNDSKKITPTTNSKDLLKLPVDNVKAKAKVFEALGASNSNLSKSSPLRSKGNQGVRGMIENEMSINVDSNKERNPKGFSDALLCQSKSEQVVSRYGIQSHGCNLHDGSHERVAVHCMHAINPLDVKKPGSHQENAGLVVDNARVANNPTGHRCNNYTKQNAPDAKQSLVTECIALDPLQSDPVKQKVLDSGQSVLVKYNALDPKQSDQFTITGINFDKGKSSHTQIGLDMGRGVPHVRKDVQEPMQMNATGLALTKMNHVHQEITGSSEVEVQTQEVELMFVPKNVDKDRSVQSISPLNEIQTTRRQSPRKYRQSPSGKENAKRGTPRKSFGNVKIEDIKESITNTPKNAIKKPRRSFSQIPTDIVASRLSKLTSTPETTSDN